MVTNVMIVTVSVGCPDELGADVNQSKDVGLDNLEADIRKRKIRFEGADPLPATSRNCGTCRPPHW